MSANFGCYQQHVNKIVCPRCGKEGSVIWEALPHPEVARRDLVRVEGDFFDRIAKKAPHSIELVCNGCGSSQPSALQA